MLNERMKRMTFAKKVFRNHNNLKKVVSRRGIQVYQNKITLSPEQMGKLPPGCQMQGKLWAVMGVDRMIKNGSVCDSKEKALNLCRNRHERVIEVSLA